MAGRERVAAVMWVRLDDQIHSHPKVQEAWHAEEASLGLHLLALSHAGCYLTDGYISEAFVKTQMPGTAKRRRVTAALVGAGLWERAPEGGWWIHDYLDYNESRERILQRRALDSDRKRNGRKVEA